LDISLRADLSRGLHQRETAQPNHLDDEVDSVAHKKHPLSRGRPICHGRTQQDVLATDTSTCAVGFDGTGLGVKGLGFHS